MLNKKQAESRQIIGLAEMFSRDVKEHIIGLFINNKHEGCEQLTENWLNLYADACQLYDRAAYTSHECKEHDE